MLNLLKVKSTKVATGEYLVKVSEMSEGFYSSCEMLVSKDGAEWIGTDGCGLVVRKPTKKGIITYMKRVVITQTTNYFKD